MDSSSGDDWWNVDLRLVNTFVCQDDDLRSILDLVNRMVTYQIYLLGQVFIHFEKEAYLFRVEITLRLNIGKIALV